ncbi:MAG: DUF1549 domain-containing protein [Planctomycetes bacterium]|nr:DUF1549 domain-containing protein [Planctomycetota bacterium]
MIRSTLFALTVVAFVPPQPGAGEPPPQVVKLRAFPSPIDLRGADDHKRLIVVAEYSDGTTREVTAQATLRLDAKSPVRLDTKAHRVSGVHDGEGRLKVAFAGHALELRVAVAGVGRRAPVSFRNDVVPVLTKAGCNAGTCHGAASGKNGFRLSLFGFDPGKDWTTLTHELRGRRTDPADVDHSLMLSKPLRQVAHQGGRRLEAGTTNHRILRDWIHQGTKDDVATAPHLTGIEVLPGSAVITGKAVAQRLLVLARYADGSTRDVTELSRLSSNNEPVATVDDAGVVRTGECGEAFVMARFGPFAEVAQVLVVPDGTGYAFPDIEPVNYIDRAVFDKLRRMRLRPTERCDDATFLRRVYLDIINQVPEPAEAAAFLADTRPDKRTRLVDALLQRPEFPDVQAMQWAEVLRIESQRLERKGMHVYTEFLRDAFRDGTPMDELVRKLLTATGSNFRDPAANFYLVQRQPNLIAEDVAQNFLGIRIQCAQCHNHPFERWTMDDYYGFAAFFARVGRKRGEHPYESIVFPRTSGEVRNQRSNLVAAPKLLGGAEPKLGREDDRRAALASWLTGKDNPWFKTTIANRLWARMFGRGLVDPVDDVRVSNPPSHPELYRLLGDKLAASGFDVRQIIRDICRSHTYQQRPGGGQTPSGSFAEAGVRRLTAEQLLDAVSKVTGVAERYRNLPSGANATQVEDGNPRNRFLDVFGRPRRTSACTCDRRSEPTLSQALHLINGETIARRVRDRNGRLHRLLRAKKPTAAILEELFLAAYARPPSPSEVHRLQQVVDKDPKQRVAALEDVFWALLNSKEFLFNH